MSPARKKSAATEREGDDAEAPELGEGASDARILEVRAHLEAAGFLERGGAGELFDDDLARAVASFRELYGLPKGAVIDAAVLDLVRTPRCGVPDVTARGWYAPWPSLILGYRIENDLPGVTREAFEAAFRGACDIWRTALPFVFRQVAASASAEIRVRGASGAHGHGSDFDGRGGVLAHASPPPPPETEQAGDVHFDADERWSVADPTPDGSFDLTSVAAHELGHSLGLPHSNVPADLMYPYYRGQHRHLTPNDRQRIEALYGVVGEALAPTDPTNSKRHRESRHRFVCPDGTAMVGRRHQGDENGPTWYRFARLRRVSTGELAVFENHEWSDWMEESRSTLVAVPGRVVIGREHDGDENGWTRYLTATVRVGSTVATISASRESKSIKESAGAWFVAPDGSVVSGSRHHGDENGRTRYSYAYVTVPR